MQCSQCQKSNSPADARFCVDCGYAMRQACPYNCGGLNLPVRADAPAAQCPKCARFVACCPVCLRLSRLGARACQTPHCARDAVAPLEPFAFHGGHAGGAPVALKTPWREAKPALLDPKAKSASANHRCGSLASRYGKIVWWKEDKLHIWAAPTAGDFWPIGAPQSLEVIDPLVENGIFPHREALLLKHGCAYLLGKNATARVALGQQNATKVTLSLRSFGEDAGDVAASWQPHQATWMAQTATSDRWFAIGRVGENLNSETLIGAKVLGSNPLFEGDRWALPPGVDVNDWQELLAWNDAPVLRCERAIWREENGAWDRVFELAEGETSLDGALVCEPYLWIWGQEKGRLWIERLNAGERRNLGSRSRPSLPFAPGDRLMSVPTIAGDRITFFVAGSQNGIATLDVTRALDEAQFQQLPAATEVLWTASATDGQSQWLLYALDDGELVRLFMMHQSPIEGQPFQLMQFRPFRDGYDVNKGATLAATIGGDCLIVSYIGQVRDESVVWLMAYAWR